GSAVNVDQHRPLTQEPGHARLGEQYVSTAHAGVRAGEQDARDQLVAAGDLRSAPWPRDRIDRPSLPADAAQYRLRAVVHPRELGGRERTDHIAAPTHADDERTLGTAKHHLGVTHCLGL